MVRSLKRESSLIQTDMSQGDEFFYFHFSIMFHEIFVPKSQELLMDTLMNNDLTSNETFRTFLGFYLMDYFNKIIRICKQIRFRLRREQKLCSTSCSYLTSTTIIHKIPRFFLKLTSFRHSRLLFHHSHNSYVFVIEKETEFISVIN